MALVAQKTQNAVAISDRDRFIEWVNDGFTRITGYEFIEVVGKTPGSFLQGEKTDLETVLAIREAIRRREPFAGELYNYAKTGRGYWLSISIMPITSDRGEHNGFISVEMDISERKAMEGKLKRAFDELEQSIEDRTAELPRMNEKMRLEVVERERAQAELGTAQKFLRKVIDDIPSLILSAGQEITMSLILRLISFSEAGLISTSVCVKVPVDSTQAVKVS